MRFLFEADTTEARIVLADVGERGRDLRPWFAGYLSPRLTVFFSKQFTTRGRIGGDPWPPLAAATITRKRRAGRDGRALVATGLLMASFAGGPGGYERLARLRYERGTSVDSYRYHHSGTTRMPRRRVVPAPFPERETDAWASGLARWLTARVRR